MIELLFTMPNQSILMLDSGDSSVKIGKIGHSAYAGNRIQTKLLSWAGMLQMSTLLPLNELFHFLFIVLSNSFIIPHVTFMLLAVSHS